MRSFACFVGNFGSKCEQLPVLALFFGPCGQKNDHPVGGRLVSAMTGSAVEGQSLAQYLIGDLTVLPGDLAIDQGHLNHGALAAVARLSG